MQFIISYYRLWKITSLCLSVLQDGSGWTLAAVLGMSWLMCNICAVWAAILVQTAASAKKSADLQQRLKQCSAPAAAGTAPLAPKLEYMAVWCVRSCSMVKNRDLSRPRTCSGLRCFTICASAAFTNTAQRRHQRGAPALTVLPYRHHIHRPWLRWLGHGPCHADAWCATWHFRSSSAS